MAYRKREDQLSSILSESEVEQLIILYKEGVSQYQIATQFDIHRNTVRNIIMRAKQSGLYYGMGESRQV